MLTDLHSIITQNGQIYTQNLNHTSKWLIFYHAWVKIIIVYTLKKTQIRFSNDKQ